MSDQDFSAGKLEAAAQEGNELQPFAHSAEDSILETATQLLLRKWLICKVAGGCMLIGLILCFVSPVKYKSITQIMPPKQTQSTTSFLNPQFGMGGLAEASGSLLSDPNGIYMGILKSRPIADSIIERFGLIKAFHVHDMTQARKLLASQTKIVSEPSTLISITVTDSDKKRAPAIANEYVDQLRSLTKAVSFSEASKRRQYFEQQLKDQKDILVTNEMSFEQLQQNKGLLHLDAQANVIIGGLATIRSQIAAKQVQLQSTLSFATEHNADVQLQERELSSLEAEAAQMEKRTAPTAYSDMGLKDVPKASLDYIRSERELRFQESIFEVILRQYEAAKLDEGKEAAVIQVVEPAIEPETRSSPRRGMIMILSTFLGLLLGCLFGIVDRKLETERSTPEGAAALDRLRSSLQWRK